MRTKTAAPVVSVVSPSQSRRQSTALPVSPSNAAAAASAAQRPARSRSAGVTVSAIRPRTSVGGHLPDFPRNSALYTPTLSTTTSATAAANISGAAAATAPNGTSVNRRSTPRLREAVHEASADGVTDHAKNSAPARVLVTPQASQQKVDDMALLTPANALVQTAAPPPSVAAARVSATDARTPRATWGGAPTCLQPGYERAQSATVAASVPRRLSGAVFSTAAAAGPAALPMESSPVAAAAANSTTITTPRSAHRAEAARLNLPRSIASPKESRRRSASSGPTRQPVAVPALSLHKLRQPQLQRGSSPSNNSRGLNSRSPLYGASSSPEAHPTAAVAASAPSLDPVSEPEARGSTDFLSHALLAINEVCVMDSDPSLSGLNGNAGGSRTWVQRGASTPRPYSPRPEMNALASSSPVSRALRGKTETSATTTPRLSASTPRFTVATNTNSLPYTARLSREGTPITGALSPSAPVAAPADDAGILHTPRQRSPTTVTAASQARTAFETDMEPDSQDYVAAVAEQVSRHFYVILTALDIGRGAALQAEPPVALCLRSMVVDLNTVASLLSYDTRNGIEDLLFDDCAFATMDLGWLARLTHLTALRFRGPRTTTSMVNRLLSYTPAVQTLTLINTSRITSLAGIATPESRVQTLQLIQTDFSAAAYENIVNSRTLKHVMLLQVHLRTNIFDLLNTNHLVELHLVGCPDVYYDGLPEADWVSSCSPRQQALQAAVAEASEKATKPRSPLVSRGRGGSGGHVRSRRASQPQPQPQRAPPDFPLRTLVIADCPALQLSKVPFCDFRHLREVSVMYQRGVRAADLADVLKQGKLTTLRLQEAFVDATLIEQLRTCTALQELNLSFCRGMRGIEAAWPALAESLRVLNVSYSDVDDDGLAGLGDCRMLCHVYARGCVRLRSFDPFRRLSGSVGVIDLTECTGLENDAFSEPFDCTGVHRLLLRGCGKVRTVTGIRTLRMLEELDLANTGVDDGAFATLARSEDSVVLQTLTKLDLSGCRSIDQLANFAAFSTTALRNLSSLNLARSSVSNAGLGHLARAVHSGGGCLSELDVSHCASVSDLASLGAVKTLRTLHASCSALNDDGLAAFVKTSVAAFNRELRVLDLSGCTGLRNVGYLGQLPRLAALNLSGTTIDGPASFPALSSCTGLQELDVSECMHVTSVATLLPRLTKLRVLNLSLTGIRDDSVAAMEALADLEVLQLSGCPGVVSVDALARLPVLQRLNLSATGVVDVAPLASCPQLWDLSLCSCATLATLQPLGQSRTLQRVDASNTPITSDSFGAEWGCASLEELDVHGCPELRGMAPGALRHLVALRRFNASETGLDNSGVAALAECTGLCEVQLSNSAVTSLSLLGVVPTLQWIAAQHTAVDDEGIDGLEVSDSLTSMDLTGCTNLRNVSALRTMRSLTTLVLRDSGVSDVSFAATWEQSGLRDLNLAGCAGICESVQLKTMRGLEVLRLTGSGLSDAGLAAVAACPALRRLNVADCCGVTNLSPLAEVVGITHLDASNTAITTLGSSAVASEAAEHQWTWPATSRLRHIVLRGCAFLTDVSALRGLPELHSADFTSSGVTAVSFADSWAGCASLEEVMLSDCTSLQTVSGLWSAPHLMQLHLARTTVESVDGAETCASLEVLDVSECKRLKSLHSVRALPRLQQLQCRESDITDDSFRERWTAPNLMEVNLSGCLQLRDVGALGSLPRLRSANFSDTFIVDGAVRELTAAATLEDLDLRGCSRLAHLGSLSRLPRIRALYLSRTCSGNFTFTSVSRCRRLEVLEMEDCPYLTNVFVVFEFGQLRHLKFPPLSRMVGSVLHSCHNLQCLSLHGCPDSFEIESLSILPRLRVLDLRESAIKKSVLAALDDCPFLEEVDVSYCTDLTSFDAMGNLPRLRCFLAAGLPVADDVCAKLTQYPLLEKVVLAECYLIRDVSALMALPQLHHLDISESGATEASFVGIRHMRGLEELSVHGCTAIRSCRLLHTAPEQGEYEGTCAAAVDLNATVFLPRLRLVDLSGTGIVAAHATADIAALRRQCPLLTKVYLTGSRASSSAAPSALAHIWGKLMGTS